MSRKIHAAITGVGGFVPDYVLTNAELETMVDTNDEWIRTRTGISERRILKGEGLGTSDIAVPAVRELLEKTNTSPDEVDLLICATITPDTIFPDTANTICAKLGISNAFGYDINAACSGFLFALTTGAKFVESGSHKKVIVVGVDKMSSIIDYTDRTTCVIFGDGGGAVLLEPNEEGNGFQDATLHGDGNGKQYLHMKAGGSVRPATMETVKNREHYVFQDGRPVFKAAVTGMSKTMKVILDRNKLTKEEINWVVPHQANKRIIESVTKMADFPPEKVMSNIHKFGNTTAGTLPLCLWDYESQLKKGDKIIFTAFGGGFTWGSIYLIWAYD
ncbi:MAG: beta-ketoacyl-ACP synthase III, partial [Bacteroidota bacterium]